ncbi:MAG: aminomethyl-transferring glycine dehydrogenase subunit GcvPA [Verrucomicrobia bacterium]|nr:aminomethyl-transferring glycine dehydrogenase subunit GcvPA [Verrucomicrobiota bacterium]
MSTYTPHTSAEIQAMLDVVGVKSLEQLYQGLESLFVKDMDLPAGKSQQEVARYFENLAAENKVFGSIFLGAGAYQHYIPPVVKSLLSREEFVTAYTPYQAEMSQGILQGIFEFQTMIAELTGMQVSNASLYDGSTALADGILMLAEKKKNKVLVSEAIHPRSLEVVKTYLIPQGIQIEKVALENGRTSLSDLKAKLTPDVFAVAVAQPNFFGVIEDAAAIGEAVKAAGAGYIMQVEPFACAMLKTPFACGADIAVGEGQPLGMPLSFGGPYLGFVGAREKLVRKLTGRIVGKTADANGNDAYVLTLQAREQHIRREKAASSICSNQALCALTATIYMATAGKTGMKEVASQCVSKAHYLAAEMVKIPGFRLKYSAEFFNEFVTVTDAPADEIIRKCAEKNILAGLKLSEHEILWCSTEVNTKADMDQLLAVLKEVK